METLHVSSAWVLWRLSECVYQGMSLNSISVQLSHFLNRFRCSQARKALCDAGGDMAAAVDKLLGWKSVGALKQDECVGFSANTSSFRTSRKKERRFATVSWAHQKCVLPTHFLFFGHSFSACSSLQPLTLPRTLKNQSKSVPGVCRSHVCNVHWCLCVDVSNCFDCCFPSLPFPFMYFDSDRHGFSISVAVCVS